jgi:phospholipid transport system substrate-binding protein
MSLRRLLALLPCVAAIFVLSAGAEEAALTPHEIIDQAATTMSEKLGGRKDYYKDNPDELYSMISDLLLPYFDTRYSGRLVLGKHWKSTSAEQRTDFIDAFYQFLLQSYADGVLDFNQDRVVVLDSEADPEGKRAIVKTEMRLDDGTDVPVNYSMRRSPAGWRVYDVRIEGVSYVQNYRNQFDAEIRANGVDSVIGRLRADTAERGAAKPD